MEKVTPAESSSARAEFQESAVKSQDLWEAAEPPHCIPAYLGAGFHPPWRGCPMGSEHGNASEATRVCFLLVVSVQVAILGALGAAVVPKSSCWGGLVGVLGSAFTLGYRDGREGHRWLLLRLVPGC